MRDRQTFKIYKQLSKIEKRLFEIEERLFKIEDNFLSQSWISGGYPPSGLWIKKKIPHRGITFPFTNDRRTRILNLDNKKKGEIEHFKNMGFLDICLDIESSILKKNRFSESVFPVIPSDTTLIFPPCELWVTKKI